MVEVRMLTMIRDLDTVVKVVVVVVQPHIRDTQPTGAWVLVIQTV